MHLHNEHSLLGFGDGFALVSVEICIWPEEHSNHTSQGWWHSGIVHMTFYFLP